MSDVIVRNRSNHQIAIIRTKFVSSSDQRARLGKAAWPAAKLADVYCCIPSWCAPGVPHRRSTAAKVGPPTLDSESASATTGLDDLTAKVITALERLTQLPQLIRAFFGDSNLRYITA